MLRMTEDEYRRMTGQPAKTNKYHAHKEIRDGIRFDSKKEADRWDELRMWEKAGIISNLRRQVKYKLPGGITYVADFVYQENGREVIEDVKGYRTAVYRMKKKLMKELGYDIKEV